LGNAVTGEQTSASWVERAFGTDADFNENRVTPAFLVAKRQEWMPELHGGQVLSKEQRDAYDRAVKSLVKCGLEESSCATKPFESSF
jgi:hypothetical protein